MKKTKFIILDELLTKLMKEPHVSGMAISTCHCKSKPEKIMFTVKDGNIFLSDKSSLGSNLRQLINIYDIASKMGERGEVILSTPKVTWKISYNNTNRTIYEISNY